MMRSLFSGVSGIKVHQTRMDVIGNNIANINTIGFKGSRTTFSDMLSQLQSAASAATATRGGVNPRQVGLGVNVESIDLIFTDSSPQSTGKNTDLALAGEGLFYLREGNQSYYTRNGSFLFDEGGNYVMAGTGFRVQGWNASSEGEINTNGASTDIVVPIGKTMEATETTSIKYSGNLNKESKMIKSISYTKSNSGDADDSLVVTKSPSYSTAISITVPEGYQLSSGEEAITGTIKGSTQYTVDGDNADVSAEIFAKRVRGARDNERDGEEAYFYNLIYTDADGNELGRVRSTTSYTNTEVPDLPDITANATANSVAEDVTTSVNVDGTNVVSATITFRDGTQQTVTSGYYEVGKSIPITTLATIYDSLGGKHEVTILLDKDPNSTGGDATPVDDDAISSGKTTYVYYDDSHTRGMAERAHGKVCYFSRKEELQEGAYVRQADNRLVIIWAGKVHELCTVEELGIKGGHNVENALAAAASAFLMGATAEEMVPVLKAFKGVEHRIEPVRELDGVAYYNDSKATNTDSAIKALETFPGHIILLAGGDDKLTDLTEFMGLVKERCDELILLGAAAERFQEEAIKNGYPKEHIHMVGFSMEEAVATAHKLAKAPQVVLLSPACASFDMYEGFEARGRDFKRLVNDLR